MSARIICGDVREMLATLDDNSVDAIVTDPPYELAFMGRSWDRSGIANSVAMWSEALRVLKPGGHLLAFGGTRTYHRMTCAIEDAGFEIRDCLQWLYGSGFPKSLDVSKAIDKAAGAEREVIRERSYELRNSGGLNTTKPRSQSCEITAPATPDAERWEGWGTALKPGYEPIVLARKPLSELNVAANVLRWGTGALNIDGCRIPTDDVLTGSGSAPLRYGGTNHRPFHDTAEPRGVNQHASGRWPANVILDECAAEMLDAQSGERPAGGKVTGNQQSRTGESGIYGHYNAKENQPYYDNGGASRFFYVAKASREERNRGLAALDERPLLWSSGTQNPGSFQSPNTNRSAHNHHPTVKPIELMQYLCRLVTPSGGTVLDPFAGSGSTLIAALREGFAAVGIDVDDEYCELARRRVIGDAPLLNSVDVVGIESEERT